ncbi:MAG: DNA polymerase [Candidatus Saccharibacteria bacterium]|nr:DNA polymerase [Candidatus Saccharibacteria bacterium]
MNRLVLIDGKSVFYRGYYAMGALSLPDGTPTGGIYGFAAIAMEIVKKLNPSKIVVAWDSKTSTAKRKAIYEDYKAGRVKPGEDFYTQIPLLKRLINDLGWSFIELDNYEADDIIGTLSKQADEAKNYETYIISSDLDMLQIVDENTHMWRILKGFSNIEKIDVKEIEEKYGIKKNQFLDLKALKGDSSDNIPGVPGIGEKTAAKLLNDYGTLENIYQNLDKITGSTKTKLEAGKDSAMMSKKLAEIMFDAPINLTTIPDFEFNKDKVINGLKKLQFNSLIRKIGGGLGNSVSETVRDNGSGMSEEPRDDGRDEARRENTIPSPASGPSRESAISSSNDTILDWDIKGLMHEKTEIAKKIESGAKYWDLGQAEFLLNPLDRGQSDKYDPMDFRMAYQVQYRELTKIPRLYNIYTEFDLPLIPVLYKMEIKGMLIDRDYFAKLRTEYEEELHTLEQKIYTLSGITFNINSPIQLSEVLFMHLGLATKGIKKTTRGYSTGAKELDKLKNEHPIIKEIIKYRETSKLLNTYIIPMPDLADDNDRIHTTFTQNVTSTGRLSSKDPNLQNIPVRTEEGKRIRAGFVAPKGKKLVSADYSQFELRLAAIMSGDQSLIDDFNNSIDIHTKTASEAFHTPINQVTKNQRRAAKAINFGIIYGMSINGLAEATKMNFYDAKRFMDNYQKLRAPIMDFMKKTLEKARTDGYVETYFGRRRPTPDVKSSNFLIRTAAERAAGNMPIQGTEADLMKRAMINIDKKLPKNANLIMQVHDSLIVECDEKDTDEISQILKQEMEQVAPELKVKLAVDVTIGDNWGEL